ncbi:hypothetical protein [Gordonia sp. (in: high G+C Gram-positive bacteria)]|uniref:hypothetical protein n=1 Tax=Gordonia sp. (in: high G+C Gram-positive bacteria) TaxID=84139 RepID=UPI0039E3E24B
MKKILSAVLVSGAAAATGAALIAAPAAQAVPSSPYARIQFTVENQRLVASATRLPYGPKTCHFYRGLQGPESGSLGDNVQMAERYTTRREVTLFSRPMRPGFYNVRLICVGRPEGIGLRRIIAERDGRLRVTPWGNRGPYGQNQQGPRGQNQGPRGENPHGQQGPRGGNQGQPGQRPNQR